MKSKVKFMFLAFTSLGFFANPAMGAVTLENGSLAVAFYEVTATTNNTLVFDLGQASNYRENTANGVSVSTISGGPVNANIGTALIAAFGSSWASSGNVRWMVVGNVEQLTATINGDPARTSYFSVARNDFSVGTTFPSLTSSQRIQSSNSITAFFKGTQSETFTVSNADATVIPTSDLYSVDEYSNFESSGTYFTLGQDITQTLGSAITNGPSGLQLDGALDIYRVIHTTTGADRTAGYSTGDAVVGAGQYIGTIALDSSGNLSVIPEPSAALLTAAGAFGLCLRRRRSA